MMGVALVGEDREDCGLREDRFRVKALCVRRVMKLKKENKHNERLD